MRKLNYWLQRLVAMALTIMFALPFGGSGRILAQQTPAAEQTNPAQQTTPAAPAVTGSSSSPQAADSVPSGTPVPETEVRQQNDAAKSTAQQQTTAQQPKNDATAPVGTAVAPYEKGIGVAASRPAGAVIAPAKQRRTRSFLIKSALVLGAAVAIGSVVGLSNASPSRPR